MEYILSQMEDYKVANQQLEEINYNTQNNMNNFIPIDENEIARLASTKFF